MSCTLFLFTGKDRIITSDAGNSPAGSTRSDWLLNHLSWTHLENDALNQPVVTRVVDEIKVMLGMLARLCW